MPLTTLKATLTCYKMGGEPARLDAQGFAKRLQAGAFIPIDHTPSEAVSTGWVALEDINADVGKLYTPTGAYHFWGLRVDTRKPNKATVTNLYNKALAAEISESKKQGKSFVSRDRKREIKEQMYLKAQARTLPVPKVIQVCYNQAEELLMIASTSAAELEMFEELIGTTFDTHIEEDTIPSWVEEILPDDHGPRLLSEVEHSTGNAEYRLMTQFLTWLWFTAETTTPAVEVYNAVPEYYIDGKLVLEEAHGDVVTYKSTIITSPEDYEYYDTKYAMWKNPGRQVGTATMIATLHDETYEITLNAHKPATIIAKTPNIRLRGEQVSDDGPFLDKMHHLETVRALLSALFAAFIKTYATRWDKEAERIHEWLSDSAPACEKSEEH